MLDLTLYTGPKPPSPSLLALAKLPVAASMEARSMSGSSEIDLDSGIMFSFCVLLTAEANSSGQHKLGFALTNNGHARSGKCWVDHVPLRFRQRQQ